MLWNKSERKLKDNEVEIGTKHPIYYAFSIAAVIKKYGECRVFIEKGKTFFLQGINRSMEKQWSDVSKFLNAFDVKVVDNKETSKYTVLVVVW